MQAHCITPGRSKTLLPSLLQDCGDVSRHDLVAARWLGFGYLFGCTSRRSWCCGISPCQKWRGVNWAVAMGRGAAMTESPVGRWRSGRERCQGLELGLKGLCCASGAYPSAWRAVLLCCSWRPPRCGACWRELRPHPARWVCGCWQSPLRGALVTADSQF